MMDYLKRFRELEANASWGTQLLGVVLFYISWKLFAGFSLLGMALALGDGHYLDYANFLGLMFGVYVYYKVLKERGKKPVPQN
jgi:hypothetical protein